MKNIKLAIAVPLSHNSVPLPFFESYVAMIKQCRHMFLHASSYQGVDHMRNQLIEGAIVYNCSHILFLDVDHRHHPETITKLLSHKLPIVSGLSYTRNADYEPCMFRGMINKYETITEWEENSLVEVDSVGASCLLVDMKVFNDIQRPYFKFMENPDPTAKYGIGEDVVFCNKAKQAGYKIYVDTSCTNKHIGQIEVDGDIYKKWNGAN